MFRRDGRASSPLSTLSRRNVEFATVTVGNSPNLEGDGATATNSATACEDVLHEELPGAIFRGCEDHDQEQVLLDFVEPVGNAGGHVQERPRGDVDGLVADRCPGRPLQNHID